MMRDNNTITVLHVDDEESFLEVTSLFLKERTGGKMEIDSTVNAKHVFEKIKHKEYDVIISDYRMPEMDGLQLLKQLRDQNNEIPFIILTGQGREEVAIDALNLGADRYILKGMDSESMYQELHHAIITVAEHRHTQKALRESEEILRDLVKSRTEYLEKLHNTLSDAVFSVKLPEKTIEYVNPSIERIFGYKPEECINKSTRLFYPTEEGFGALGDTLREAIKNEQSIVHNEYSLKRKNGEIFPSEITTTFFKEDGKVTKVISIVHDISDRKQLSAALHKSKKVAEALRESDEAYRKSEERLKQAVQIAKLGFWEWDIITGDLYWSDEGFRSIGDEPQSYKPTFDKFISMLHPEDVETVQESVNAALNDNKDYAHDFRYLYPNGDIRHFHTQGEVTYDKNGKAIRFVGTQQDITELIEFQQALQESEERLQLAVGGTGDGIWDWNVKTREIVIDDKLKKTLRYPPGEQPFDYQWLKKSIEPESFLIFEKALDDYVKGRCKYYELEYPVKRKTGDYIWIWARGKCVEYDDKGQPLGFIGTYRDITARKHVKNVLKKEKDKAQRFLDVAGVILLTLNKEGKVTLINKKGCQLLGYSAQEIIGKDWFDSFLPKDVIATVKDVFHSLMDGNVEPVEYFENTVLTKNGEERTVGWYNTVLYNDSGIIIGTLASGGDITDRKKAEKALLESETKFKSIFNNSPIAMEIYNTEGLLSDINKAGLDIFGVDDFNEVGGFKLFQDPNIPDDQKNNLKRGLAVKYESVFDFEKVQQGKLYRTTKSGRIFLEVFIEPIVLDDRKSPDGYLVYLQDITERKHAEEALKIEKDKAQRYLDVACVILLTLNKEGKVTLINKKGCQLLGYSVEEIIGKEWFDSFLPKELSTPVREVFHELIAGNIEIVEYYENPVLTKSGEERLIGWHNTLLYDEDGLIVGTLTSGEDITERKQAEIVLRESQERVQLAIEGTGDGIWDWNIKTGEIAFDDNWKQVLGYSPEEQDFDYQWWEKSIEPASFPVFERTLDDYIKGRNKYFEFEYQMKRKTGEYIWIWARGKCVEYDDEGKQLRFIGTHRDITERKQTEKAISESEERLRSFMDSATYNFTLFDSKLNFIDINEISRKVFGLPKEDIIGKNIIDLNPRVKGSQRFKEYFEVIKTGNNFETEVEFGDRFFTVRAFKAGSGMGMISIDITDRKQAEKALLKSEEALKKIVEELQEKNKELQDFGFILTHDIKTPVRNIKLYSDLVLKEPTDSLTEKTKDYVTSIIAQTTHMEALIDGIYQYSKIEKFIQKIEKIDINELLSELLDVLTLADNIEIDYPPDFPVIDGDRTQIIQVFSNLIGNAIKFMDKPKGHIAIRYEDKNNFWQFSVLDNGPGIEEKHFERIFKIFQTLGTKKGTGLGLAIVKRIVEVNGGKIWLESTIGKGSTFYFTLLK